MFLDSPIELSVLTVQIAPSLWNTWHVTLMAGHGMKAMHPKVQGMGRAETISLLPAAAADLLTMVAAGNAVIVMDGRKGTDPSHLHVDIDGLPAQCAKSLTDLVKGYPPRVILAEDHLACQAPVAFLQSTQEAEAQQRLPFKMQTAELPANLGPGHQADPQVHQHPPDSWCWVLHTFAIVCIDC